MLWFLGGDERAYWTVRALREHGLTVHAHAVPRLESEALPDFFSRLLLPFPSFRDGLLLGSSITIQDLLTRLHAGSRVYGGMLQALRAACPEPAVEFIDLYDTEPLTTVNGLYTAEAALGLAILHSPLSLQGAQCLVIGAGRIGTLLSHHLNHLGAEVTLAARKDRDLALAAAQGYHPEQTGRYLAGLNHYDFIFNTVPAPVLSNEQLCCLKKDCLLMELASKPGGFSQSACAEMGLRCIDAGGLPGKYKPKSAGILYAQSILKRGVDL